MTNKLNIALAQINTTVGDLSGNAAAVIAHAKEAATQGADLVVFPEMTITGYPPEDLVFKRSFQDCAMREVERIAQALQASGVAVLVGGLWREDDLIFNASFLIDGGEVLHRQYKRELPNYGVFDEKRLFAKGEPLEVMHWRGMRFGVMICEDVWNQRWPNALREQGAQLLIVQNASPYEMGKAKRRKLVATAAAQRTGVPVIYLNLVAGQDELVFDGRSFAVDAGGEDVVRLKAFEEEVAITRWSKDGESWQCDEAPMIETQSDMETVYQAMVLGLRDYVNKNGFKGVVLGLSGGIDSGLTAAVAVDALGAERVHGVLMPSPYTSDESIEDATQLAETLKIRFDTVAIDSGMQAFDEMLAGMFEGMPADTTEENIQARIRGNVLMAVSNKLGSMVLTTGNKSEMSVGYATLYGDMCGGYSVLKDVYKTTVSRLSHWRNEVHLATMLGPKGAVIPTRMITKPPSAELKPDQKDEDSLPPYDVLDAILQGLLEENVTVPDLVARGHDEAVASKVAQMLYMAEYKRRQAPPGVKVSGMSFGRDRRYPITNKWIWQQKR